MRALLALFLIATLGVHAGAQDAGLPQTEGRLDRLRDHIEAATQPHVSYDQLRSDLDQATRSRAESDRSSEGASSVEARLGRVIGITPANSLLVRYRDSVRPVQVVLAYLSIPLGNMPYAARAREILVAQLLDKQVNVRKVGVQGEGYESSLVYVRGNNFNVDFLRRGHAWVDHRHRPPRQWLQVEAAARSAGVGLWSTDHGGHPLDYKASRARSDFFLEGLSIVQSDASISDGLHRARIGDRQTKMFYPLDCIDWVNIPRHRRRIFTSEASAQGDGYQKAPCS